VPAGNDAFPIDLMRRYFASYPAKVGINFEAFATFGQNRTHPTQPFNNNDPFSMTILALRMSRHANGVSKLHGAVSRGLWKSVWTGVPEDEVPITSITNGIHTKTWTAPEFAAIYDQYLPGWEENLTDPDFWRGVIEIPDEVLWDTHQALKKRLVEFVRDRVRNRRRRHGESPERIRQVNSLLDPEILTVGFARRFATYKRATLLFADLERLAKLVTHPERPVQFIFAGKAHPKDEPGKKFIQEVYKFSRLPQFEGRIVFVEDYDHYVGRRLTQGVDLWLNTPRRPLEASGTSGMKLPPNGGLNFSVRDGWWIEAANGKNGWNIGGELPVSTQPCAPAFEDEVDSASLLHVLETQIVPLFYAKPDGRLPVAWIQLMRESIRSVTPVFNTHRMVKQYAEELYEPAARAVAELSANGWAPATELSTWKDRIRNDWPLIRVIEVKIDADPLTVKVGDRIAITARVQLGKIEPEYVRVQTYVGETPDGQIQAPTISELSEFEKISDGLYLYRGRLEARESGSYGLSVRVIPTHPNLIQPHELRLIAWAN
jgi:starch phosphorylase